MIIYDIIFVAPGFRYRIAKMIGKWKVCELGVFSGRSRISKREVPTQIHSQALPDSCQAIFCNTRYNKLSSSYVHSLQVVVCMTVHSSAN